MKKITLMLCLSALLLSCKKNYNCRCTTTVIYSNGQDYHTSKNTAMSEKMTEKQAKSVCAHETDNLNETYANIFSGNGSYSSGGVTSVSSCNLQ